MGTDDRFTYNDEVSPLVLAYQFFLMFSVVCKLAIKSHFFMLDPWSLFRQEGTRPLTTGGASYSTQKSRAVPDQPGWHVNTLSVGGCDYPSGDGGDFNGCIIFAGQGC